MIPRFKKLITRFTGAETKNIFELYPELTLQHPIMERLKTLCNSLEKEIADNSANRILRQMYTNVLACLVDYSKNSRSSLKHDDFKKAGWRFKKTRFTSARKRQRNATFTDFTPMKRGRHDIPDKLKKMIEKV